MLKVEHLIAVSHLGEFSKLRYLLDYHPNESIDSQSIINVRRMSLIDGMKIMEEVLGKMEHVVYDFFTNQDRSILLDISSTKSKKDNTLILTFITIYYCTKSFNVDKFNVELREKIEMKPSELRVATFSLFSIQGGHPKTVRRALSKQIVIDKEASYNTSVPLEEVYSIVESPSSGLVLLTGEPGTGKTTLLKWMCQEMPDKEFYFISGSNIDVLSNPNFVGYCMDNMQDAVIIIEDCENLLLDRRINKSFDISNILNMTDGIVGDMLNVKLIVTINTADKIDPALLRKGRLLKRVEFKKLRKEQVVKLSQYIGKEITEPVEMVLTDVYNQDQNGMETQTPEKIGFKTNK